MHGILRLAAATAVAITLGTTGLATAEDECREEFGGGTRQDVGPVTVYTDDVQTYVGVCGFGRNGYVQVNEVAGALAGQKPVAEGRTGVKDVDKAINNGPAAVWAQNNDSCAPEGDNAVGNNSGSHVARELPTVYTDGGATHVGVCDRRGNYVQVNDVNSALAGGDLIEVGNRDDD